MTLTVDSVATQKFDSDRWLSVVVNVLSEEIVLASLINSTRISENGCTKRVKLFESRNGTIPYIPLNDYMWRCVDFLYKSPSFYVLVGFYMQKYLKLKYELKAPRQGDLSKEKS